MTGFGRGVVEGDGVAFEVEIRSVNHRHLDVRLRLPKGCGDVEGELRERIARRVSRGKLEVSVTIPERALARPQVEVDFGVVARYLELSTELKQRYWIAGDLDLGTLLRLPEVVRTVEPTRAEGSMDTELFAAVDEALDALLEMRLSEGGALERDLRVRLARVEELVSSIEERSREVVASAKERLARRVAELRQDVGPLDEARLHQEVVLAADRLDITEEVVRSRSHVRQFEKVLDEAEQGTPVGRKLDFLLQEMGREANTMGSKGNDASVAHFVVELKTECERIREQVQNIE